MDAARHRSRTRSSLTSLGLSVGLLLTSNGCYMVPNGSGCRSQEGRGPRDQSDPPGIPLGGIAGLTPLEAEAAAAARGHNVAFRLDHLTCICIATPGWGPVSEGWWSSRGVLFIDLQDVTPQGQRLPDGAGC